MKNSVLTLGCLLPVLLSQSIPGQPVMNVYYPALNLLYCDGTDACIHEIGHAVDDQMGLPSQSEEYQKTVLIYLLVARDQNNPLDKWQRMVTEFPGIGVPIYYPNGVPSGGHAELYAEMLRQAQGNVSSLPAEFQKFYSQGLINDEMQKVGQQ